MRISHIPGQVIYINVAKRTTGGFVVVSILGDKPFDDQSSAEHFAAGVAAGLRACGRSCEVVIDVPGRQWADATHRELNAAADALGVTGAVGDRTFGDLRRDLEARDPEAKWLNGQSADIAALNVALDSDVGDVLEDMLDMGALDACAQRFDRPAESDPEADPVERRLAREAEAGRFVAEARGL
jgi:hypothetical protein